MVFWLLSKVNIGEIERIIKGECDFYWIFLMMVISVFSHIFRGIRWGIQLRGAGLRRVSIAIESVSVFGSYALNLLFPLLGETWRSVYMARQEKAPVSTVVGTVLGDRFSDALAIMLLFFLALFVAHDSMISFFDHYKLGEKIVSLLSSPWLWGVIVTIAGGFVLFCLLFRSNKIVMETVRVVKELWRSFAVMFSMKGIPLYLLLTAAIWICYFLETYVCFFAFPFTRELISQPGSVWGLVPGLVAFVFGSFSIAIPSNGGLGPWNIAVMYSLMLYGVSTTDGTAFSLVVWGFRSGMLIILGIYTAFFLLWQKWKERSEQRSL